MTQVTQPQVFAVTGNRQNGKDTLARLLTRLNPRVRGTAFAQRLKEDLAPLIREHFGVDVHTMEGETKELVRPILIAWGLVHRTKDPLHWVRAVVAHIDKTHSEYPSYQEAPIWVVTDVRYLNEAQLLRDTYPSFKLVNVTRADAPPPTEEETKHYRTVAGMSDYHLAWGRNTPEEQLAHARTVMGWLGLTPPPVDDPAPVTPLSP